MRCINKHLKGCFMKTNRIILTGVAILLIVVMSLSPIYAQDGAVTCDADLILDLYIAEKFFDFDTFAAQLPADMAVDIDNIDRGQFEPLFGTVTGAAATNLSDEFHNHLMETMAMTDAEFDEHLRNEILPDVAGDSDVSALTTLPANDVSGETAECAALRRALRRFYTALAFGEAEFGGFDTSTDTGTGTTTDTTDSGASAGAITVNLSGAVEVPGPGDEDASGTAVVYLRGNTNEVCVDLSVQNITLPATAAHIHRGVQGQSGPPVVPLTAPGENGLSNTCTTVDAALMQELIIDPQNFYVNVHNADFPDGAARGQLQ